MESAVTARKTATDAEIDIFSAETALPYRRPALSGLLGAGKILDEKTFYIKTAAFFSEQRINFHPGCQALAVEDKKLILTSGEKIGFDKLILACGSNAVRPPIAGAENAGTLRSLADMTELRAKLDRGVKNAVIIGGGVLGLEIADSLLSRKINTTVFEMSPQLFPGRLPAEDAAALARRLNDIELLKIIFNSRISRINTDSVITDKGDVFPAGIIICATGCRPDLTLALSAGLDCGRGVKVDEFMCSSDPDIFAAGDLAEFNGKCFNLYLDAIASGKVAGANAAGSKIPFTAKPAPMRLMALGEKLLF